MTDGMVVTKSVMTEMLLLWSYYHKEWGVAVWTMVRSLGLKWAFVGN